MIGTAIVTCSTDGPGWHGKHPTSSLMVSYMVSLPSAHALGYTRKENGIIWKQHHNVKIIS